MKEPTLTETLEEAMERCDLTITDLANRTGLKYQTLRGRLRNPAMWRFWEWAAVTRHVDFNKSELEIIRKEVIGV